MSLRAPSTVKIKGTFQSRKSTDTVQSYIAGWDWIGNIKPQMDAAVALGANALHLSSVASAVQLGYVTQQQLLDRFKQQLDYSVRLGVAVYVGLFYAISDLTNATNQTTAGAVAALCEKYPNVIGYDMCNEITGTPGDINTAMAALVPVMRANTSKPLTCSLNITSAALLTGASVQALASWVDLYDFHNYAATPLVPADFATLRGSSFYKPWLIGESGQSRASGSTAVLARWNANKVLAAEPDCFGAFGYTLIDFIDDFGIYSTTLGGSADTDMTGPFANWPARL